MGNPDNITENTFKHLSEHLKKSLPETKLLVYKQIKDQMEGKKVNLDPHLSEMFDKAAVAWGQTVDEAKKNTLDLLRREVNA